MGLTVTCRAQGISASLGKCHRNIRERSRVLRVKGKEISVMETLQKALRDRYKAY